MTVEFRLEGLTDGLFDEIEGLAEAHLGEVAAFRGIEPRANREQYRRAESAGILRVFTARAGVFLVGYAVFQVAEHPHFTGSVQATQDMVYLAPGVRKGWVGTRFLRWCDEQLREEGVEVVHQFSSMRRDIGPVLARIGYEKTQEVWARRLANG
jgi:GNAT superfamily N-acetyltransferase